MGTTGDFRLAGRVNWQAMEGDRKGAPTVTRLAASASSSPARADYRCTSDRFRAGTAKRDALESPTTNRKGGGNSPASPQKAGGRQ